MCTLNSAKPFFYLNAFIMKRTRIIFPLLFFIALAGSAFTLHSHSAKKDQMIIYYYDPNWNTCDATEIEDGACFSDDLGYICMVYIPGLGYQYAFQDGFGSTCYQPFYSYVP
jgi:hypothetical protein